MRWLLAGCCGLALVHLSVSLQLSQRPRFYGLKTNTENVMIYCLPSKSDLSATVQWYKGAPNDKPENRTLVKAGHEFSFHDRKKTNSSVLMIHKVFAKDSGVYFCKTNEVWGSGTHLLVVKWTDISVAVHRSRMKDGLIILQGLLMAACIAAVVLRKNNLRQKEDGIYEEPETDHIYEGLAIESCGGGLYEELTVYAQPETTEAPWE
ncbi:B-cell antigen receptor complex-associated protein beta chain [Betta splendens]|uniref:B-cell antigen receptor complex-associated protein beta chain n=1 Tax=Betta splendens TaxID=158456 RepID=A0A6P7L4Y1_BETSP|nr:B-cell antigen receptor complex-associated protein beta chain [Betta splendens]